jgi:hypothetical protein
VENCIECIICKDSELHPLLSIECVPVSDSCLCLILVHVSSCSMSLLGPCLLLVMEELPHLNTGNSYIFDACFLKPYTQPQFLCFPAMNLKACFLSESLHSTSAIFMLSTNGFSSLLMIIGNFLRFHDIVKGFKTKELR